MSSSHVHHSSAPPSRHAGARRGFTLVELMVSVAMVAVLSVAMGSAVLIASRAIDKGDSSASRTIAAADVVERIKSELRLATGFSQRTAKAVAFTVPDRDGDGAEESIGYAWSGVPGGPLVRTYNDAAPETVAEDVRTFDLAYLVQSIDPPTSGGGDESPEMLLIAHEDAPGGTIRTYTVEWERWCAQYFKPTLPADAVSWKVTRVQFMARQDRKPFDGVIRVVVSSANAGETPAYPILDEAQVNESSLSSQMSWVNVPFTKVQGIDPSQGLCLVIAHRNGNNGIAVVQYEDGGGMTANTHWTTTNNLGFSYTAPNTRQDMLFRVYGTVTTSGDAR